jgi:hypothetical protein
MFDAVARPYAKAVGGDLASVSWDRTALTVAFSRHAGVPATHEVFWPRGNPSATCDGSAIAPTASDAAASSFTFACGGHTLVVQ